MTKTELLAKISEKFYKVPTPELIDEKFGIKEYKLYPWVKDGDNVYKQYVSFCVEKEGTVDELAYWSGGEPRQTPISTFTKKATTYILAKIEDGTIKFGYLVSSDESVKKGMAIAITPVNAKKDILISEDIQGVITHIIL